MSYRFTLSHPVLHGFTVTVPKEEAENASIDDLSKYVCLLMRATMRSFFQEQKLDALIEMADNLPDMHIHLRDLAEHRDIKEAIYLCSYCNHLLQANA